ncbi:MAG: sulfatase [Planctomycetes bacterium]|nr:sulfatase [Planctomycetota bacterium]
MASRGRRRPNIVLIVTDDQRYDGMSCAGNPIVRTPEMDRLAAEGVWFTRAFVTTPICAASRATIFTGLYERTHGYTFRTPPICHKDIEASYPCAVRRAGYHTGFVGKFGVSVEGGRKTINEMFDFFRPLGHPYFKVVDGRRRHLTDITCEKAIEFLDDWSAAAKGRADEKPFCLSISFNAPHAEDSDKRQYLWPESCDGLYEDMTVPPAPMSDPKYFQAQPGFVRRGMNRIRWKWRFDTPEKYQRMVKGYYRLLTGVDRAIGRFRAELARRGLADNTVIILIGDNGYFLGERGFAGKWLLYEPSIHVPLIIFDPRMPAGLRGRKSDSLVLNMDLAPTIEDLAGAKVPPGVQGKSLLGLLVGKNVKWRSDFLCEHLFNHKDIPQSEGVRTVRWKYFRYRQHPGFEELYDLAADPMEKHNLAGDPQYKTRLEGLRQRCDELIRQAVAARRCPHKTPPPKRRPAEAKKKT